MSLHNNSNSLSSSIRRIWITLLFVVLLCQLTVTRASITLLDDNRTFASYDFYGETDVRPYNFSGQLVRTSFVPDQYCTLNPELPAINATAASSGIVILVDRDEFQRAGCASFSWALRSLPRDYPGTAISNNTSSVMVFVSADDSSVAFGCKEVDVLDDYWYAVPPRLQLAIVSSDTGRTLSSAISSSSTKQPRVAIVREAGPWAAFYESTFLAVFTWFIRILDGFFALFSLLTLFLSYKTRGAGPVGWLKPLILLTLSYFATVNIFCQMQLPDKNSRILGLYIAFLIGNAVFSVLIVRWSAFMRRLGGYKMPYYILFGLCVLNILFFSAAMLVSIVSLYSKQAHLREVGFLLYTTLGTALFLAEAVAVCYAGYLYIGYLRALTASPGIVRLLQFETASLFIFCIGRMLIAVATILLASKAVNTIVGWKAMNGSYHTGVFLLLAGLCWMFWLQLDHKTAYGNYNPSTDKSNSRRSTTLHGSRLSQTGSKIGRRSTTKAFDELGDFSDGEPAMMPDKTFHRVGRLTSLPEDDLLYTESLADSVSHHRYPPRSAQTHIEIVRDGGRGTSFNPDDDEGDIDGTVVFSAVGRSSSSHAVRVAPSNITIDSFLDEIYNSHHIERQQSSNLYSLPARVKSPPVGVRASPSTASIISATDHLPFQHQSQSPSLPQQPPQATRPSHYPRHIL
ncbi:hypothetical protein GQ42DRAFT_155479 [Ramicandelaber brevisporus]|nr:hypothetical protein GQ42DRAFT_155479 [Ramicandelaber brevisporus]